MAGVCGAWDGCIDIVGSVLVFQVQADWDVFGVGIGVGLDDGVTTFSDGSRGG